MENQIPEEIRQAMSFEKSEREKQEIRTKLNKKIALELVKAAKEIEKKINKDIKILTAEYEYSKNCYLHELNSKPAADTRWFFDFWSESPEQKHQREIYAKQVEHAVAFRKLLNKIENKSDDKKKEIGKKLHLIKLEHDVDYRNAHRRKLSNVSKVKKSVYKRPSSDEVLGIKSKSKLKPTTPESRLKNKLKPKLQPNNKKPF